MRAAWCSHVAQIVNYIGKRRNSIPPTLFLPSIAIVRRIQRGTNIFRGSWKTWRYCRCKPRCVVTRPVKKKCSSPFEKWSEWTSFHTAYLYSSTSQYARRIQSNPCRYYPILSANNHCWYPMSRIRLLTRDYRYISPVSEGGNCPSLKPHLVSYNRRKIATCHFLSAQRQLGTPFLLWWVQWRCLKPSCRLRLSPAVFDGVQRDMDESGLRQSPLLIEPDDLSPRCGQNDHTK